MDARPGKAMTGDVAGGLADLQRGLALAVETERETVRLLFVVESVGVLVELGRLQEAADMAREGVELARLAGSPPLSLWAQSALACARLAAGDIASAMRDAEEGQISGTRPDFCATGQPGWCLGLARAAAGEPDKGARAMLRSVGGLQLPLVFAADRPAAAADLAEVPLAAGRAGARSGSGHRRALWRRLGRGGYRPRPCGAAPRPRRG